MNQKPSIVILLFISIVCFIFTSCESGSEFNADFDNINDRLWIGRDFWSIPMEDWKVEDGKLHCTGEVPDSRVFLLTRVLSPGNGTFRLSAAVSLNKEGRDPGSAGFIIGAYDEEDPCIRAACYFGEGVRAGVSLNGYAFLKDEKVDLPEGFTWESFNISISGNNRKLTMVLNDAKGYKTSLECRVDGIKGPVALANNLDPGEAVKPGKSHFVFDDLKRVLLT